MDELGDGISSAYIVGVSYGTSAVVPAGMAYAVTTLTGNSIESEPAYSR